MNSNQLTLQVRPANQMPCRSGNSHLPWILDEVADLRGVARSMEWQKKEKMTLESRSCEQIEGR